MQPLKAAFGAVDVQLIFYMLLALIPNLLLMLWAMARLSRDVRVLRAKLDMTETDIGLLDQSISSLTTEFQSIRKVTNEAGAGSAKPASAKTAGHTE